MTVCFLGKRQKGVDTDGKGCVEELGEVKRKKTIIRIYYMIKYTFNKRKKKMDSINVMSLKLLVSAIVSWFVLVEGLGSET